MYRLAMLLLAALPDGNASGTELWEKVERLRHGQTLRVLCFDQRSWTGRLQGVSAGAIELDVSGTARRVERAQILRIQVKSRATSALIGLGIGAAAGVGVGYAAGAGGGLKSGEIGSAVALGAGLFGAAGAGIGCLIPGWKTVYSANAPSGGKMTR